MNNPVLYQALGVLLILFFLFLTYMFTKTWRWFHVLCAFLVFCAAVAFCFYAAMSHRARVAWGTIERQNREKAENLQSEFEKLLYGDLTQVEQTELPLRAKNANLARFVFDQGRVWRGVTPQGPPQQDGTVTLNTAPAAGGGAATDNRIIDKMVLYAFTEADAPPELGLPAGTRLPASFIGEFTVTARTPTSVTLSPTLHFPPPGGPWIFPPLGNSWVLYETMPVDGHEFFADDPDRVADLRKTADEEPVFGVMNQDFITRLLPPPPRGPNQTDAEYQLMLQMHQGILDGYLRDGKRAAENDSPENIWAKVTFTAAHEEAVDSDATLGGVEGSQDFFDRGRAEIPLLRRGEPAKFQTDDVGLFPLEDARGLQTRGVATMGETIYVRPLNDYEYLFRNVFQRLVTLREDSERSQRNIDQLTAANDRTLAQISFHQQESTKLRADLAKYVYERDALQQYVASLQKLLSDTQATLSRLYRTNHQLEQELTRMNDELNREMERRSGRAVAGVRSATRP